jgi:hypothetical protein
VVLSTRVPILKGKRLLCQDFHFGALWRAIYTKSTPRPSPWFSSYRRASLGFRTFLHRQNRNPLHHATKKPPRQMDVRQQQSTIPGALDEPAVSRHPLLQTVNDHFSIRCGSTERVSNSAKFQSRPSSTILLARLEMAHYL